ncbi:hypothetical protein C2W62_17550 [Candidatus Entotheonella serta]|nr:hypothetical protein C2W62_17550 [Candidatus Entotheonella serta]
MREQDFFKRPGVVETLDWSLALLYLGQSQLDIPTIRETLGCILKYKEDIDKVDNDFFATILKGICQI